MRLIIYSLFMLLGTAAAFVIPTTPRATTRFAFALRIHQPHASDPAASEGEQRPIECFVVNDLEIKMGEEEVPLVVCTSEPDEYAWFNGIDRAAMRPATEKDAELTTECVEGASPMGIEEWECRASSEEFIK
jgi:hypothetical protein